MPECPTVETLEAFAAGHTNGGEPSSHLEVCPACRTKLDEVRANNVLLAELTAARTVRPPRHAQHAGPAIDDYETLDVIGRGAQGAVYHGIHKATKRHVALKLLHGGAFATPRQRHRFEREVELAAGLRHPNIVTIFDSGITGDGRRFCAMELIRGPSLDQFLAGVVHTCGRRPAIDDTLRLFLKICSAVEYAHQRGITHRDLKPANVLVDASNEPRIVDFGLAKDAAAAMATTLMQTQAGEFAGTFAYASPEQTQGKPDLIDTRSDVYSLGVILYEMLTGELPYAAGSLSGVLRAIAEESPRNSSAIRPEVDHDIQVILRTALAKDPDRRYQSAGLLAKDIEHYLADEPIDARRDSAWYMLRKTVRRHRVPASLAVAAIVILAIFAVAMSVAYRRTSAAEVTESARSKELADLLSISNLERGRAMGVAGNTAQAEDLLWREYFAEAAAGTFGANVSPARWALRELYMRRPCLRTVAVPPCTAGNVSISADARTVALVPTGSQSIEIWDVPTSARTVTLSAYQNDPIAVETSTDGRLVACAWADGVVQLFDVAARRSVAVRQVHQARIASLTFSKDGKSLASGDVSGVIYLWDTSGFEARHDLRGHGARVHDLAFTPDGLLLASCSGDLTVRFWDTQSGERISTPIVMDQYPVRSLAFSPDGRSLMTTSDGTGISFWNMPSCDSRRDIPPIGSAGFARHVCISPDGSRLAFVSGRAISVWNVASEQLDRSLAAHIPEAEELAYTSDGRSLVSVSRGGSIRVWDVSDASGRTTLAGHQDSVLSACYSPDGATLATASSDQTIRIWQIGNAAPAAVLRFDSIVHSVAFSSKGMLAAALNDGTIRLWRDGTTAPPILCPGRATCMYSIAFVQDGARLSSTSRDQTWGVWDTNTGACIRTMEDAKEPHSTVRFSPDAELFATFDTTGKVRNIYVSDPYTGARRMWLMSDGGPVRAVCFDPTNRTLASSHENKTIRLWRLTDGRCIATLDGHTDGVNALSFSGDGRLLASGGGGGEVKLWDVARRRCLATMPHDGTTVTGVHLSADARTLTHWGDSSVVTVWDLSYADRCIAGNEGYWRQRLAMMTPAAAVGARR